MLYFLISSFLILNGLFSFISGETGCPPEEDIRPCKCDKYPSPRLTCKNIYNADDLLNVFKASERYTFQEVHIVRSAFLYIPIEIFDYAYIKELYLKDSIVSIVFVDPLMNGSKHPYKVQIESTRSIRGHLSTNYSSFFNLTELVFKFSEVGNIPPNYSYRLPNGLKKLSFYESKTRKISPGAFSTLHNLNEFALERNRLTNLSRNIFPTPFNVKSLSFDFNFIDTIPDNMFHDMPNLQFLSMKENLLGKIPEVAFQGRVQNIPYFRFDDNPLDCDCSILWIIKDKPENLGGSCILPPEFMERSLQDLKPDEFSC